MSSFKKDFLDNYLKLGLGSMPKSDIDALVMHLIMADQRFLLNVRDYRIH